MLVFVVIPLNSKETSVSRKTVIALVGAALSGCTPDRRQIDPVQTGSFPIEGTSWRGFCQGANLFVYVPSRNDETPDELEAIIYDDYRCVAKIQDGAKPKASS
jgi:hypothetical protein